MAHIYVAAFLALFLSARHADSAGLLGHARTPSEVGYYYEQRIAPTTQTPANETPNGETGAASDTVDEAAHEDDKQYNTFMLSLTFARAVADKAKYLVDATSKMRGPSKSGPSFFKVDADGHEARLIVSADER